MNEGQGVMARCRAVLMCAVAVALLGPAAARAAKVECSIEGVTDEAIVKNIEVTLSIFRDRDRDDLTPESIARLHDRARIEIRRALEPFGYYHPSIDAKLTAEKDDHFRARYVITLGDPVRVREVSLSITGEGKSRPPFPQMVAEFPLKRGDILDQRVYDQRKNAFSSAAVDSGFLDGHFTTSVIRVQRNGNLADIQMAFDTGPRYFFGPVTFDSTSVDDRVMRAYLTFKPGDPFRYDRLLAFQSALGGAPYFSRVEAVVKRDSTTGRDIPIHVVLADRRPRRFEIGVGYGTDTGPRALLNADFRRLNRSGHHYTGRLKVSAVEVSLSAQYVIPSLYPDKHTYTLGVLAARIEPDAYTTDRFAIGPTRSQPRFGALESLTLSYEHENFTVASDNGITDLIVAGLAYRLKRADDDIFPSRGFRFDVGVRGADEAVLSTQSFLSFTASAKGVRTPSARTRLVAQVEGGTTSTPTFRELPPTIRFFAGGDNSVRGYAYQSLGPLDDTGRVVGGPLLLTTSAEIQFALKGKLGIAGFYDAGNAFKNFGSGVMEQGLGAGMRWQSPVGPIRLDFAHPLNHEGVRVHFTMGPEL